MKQMKISGSFCKCQVQEAAAKLEMGVGLFKRVCKRLGMQRWPYRMRQSYKAMIKRTEQYYKVLKPFL